MPGPTSKFPFGRRYTVVFSVPSPINGCPFLYHVTVKTHTHTVKSLNRCRHLKQRLCSGPPSPRIVEELLEYIKKTPWPESACEIYPSDHHISVKLVATFADGECHMVSVTDPYGRILRFLVRFFTFGCCILLRLYPTGSL
jgi:hypothetical protein